MTALQCQVIGAGLLYKSEPGCISAFFFSICNLPFHSLAAFFSRFEKHTDKHITKYLPPFTPSASALALFSTFSHTWLPVKFSDETNESERSEAHDEHSK